MVKMATPVLPGTVDVTEEARVAAVEAMLTVLFCEALVNEFWTVKVVSSMDDAAVCSA